MSSGPATPVCVLGFDVGARRIGVAVGNTISATARAIAMVAAHDDGPDWPAVDALVREWRPELIIVGEPLTLEGEAQLATHMARRFAHTAAERYGLPVELVDERSTSREADRRFAEQRRSGQARRRDAKALDALAAQIIVERWLGDPMLPR
ncbi:MAG: Holliday junction resolvase RuvX [Lysobacteraceae bacterium]